MIIIIDYGMGNLGSILNMFRVINVEAKISSKINDIANASKLVLPGVGSFDNAMNSLEKLKITKIINNKVLVEKTPILGICLGMQIMTDFSEEGEKKGFGWIKGGVYCFKNKINKKIRIPHMGWNTVNVIKKNNLIKDLKKEDKFYFVHSYFVKCLKKENIMLNSDYGLKFSSGIIKDNIYGLQFHPEKSHNYGRKIFKNFSSL